MTIINIIGYVAIVILICISIINPVLMIRRLKKHKKSCWHRQIEPYKHTEFHIIPTISVEKGNGTEIRFKWLHYGIYTFYNMLTADEDVAMDVAYWEMKEKDDKSKRI